MGPVEFLGICWPLFCVIFSVMLSVAPGASAGLASSSGDAARLPLR